MNEVIVLQEASGWKLMVEPAAMNMVKPYSKTITYVNRWNATLLFLYDKTVLEGQVICHLYVEDDIPNPEGGQVN